MQRRLCLWIVHVQIKVKVKANETSHSKYSTLNNYIELEIKLFLDRYVNFISNFHSKEDTTASTIITKGTVLTLSKRPWQTSHPQTKNYFGKDFYVLFLFLSFEDLVYRIIKSYVLLVYLERRLHLGGACVSRQVKNDKGPSLLKCHMHRTGA